MPFNHFAYQSTTPHDLLLLPMSTPCFSIMDHQPLLPSSTTTTIFIRLSSILAIIFLSLWANHESSKLHLQTTILPSNPSSLSGQHFNLFFVSNGAADRLIYTSTHFIQHSLYPNNLLHSNLPILHATLFMSDHNLTTDVTVTPAKLSNHFIIHLSPSLMSNSDVKASMAGAIHRGVARVWLLHCGGAVLPSFVLDEMVECLAKLAGFSRRVNDTKVEFCLERDEFEVVRRLAGAGGGSSVGSS